MEPPRIPGQFRGLIPDGHRAVVVGHARAGPGTSDRHTKALLVRRDNLEVATPGDGWACLFRARVSEETARQLAHGVLSRVQPQANDGDLRIENERTEDGEVL